MRTLSLLSSISIATLLSIAHGEMADFEKNIFDYSYKSCLLAGSEHDQGVKGHCQCSANVALSIIAEANLSESEKAFYEPIYTQQISVEELDDEAYELYEQLSDKIILDYDNPTFKAGITECYYQHIATDQQNPLTAE